MVQFGVDWALVAIKQAASLSSGTEILWANFCIYLLVSTYTKSLWLLRMKQCECGEVFVLCVMCMHTWPGVCLHPFLGVQGHSSSRDGICLVALCWPVLLCEVLCLLCVSLFLCVVMFWCLVMSSLVGAWSLIDRRDWYMFRSVSYLIFSDKILSGVFVVCCLVFIGIFLVLFFSHR